MTVRIEANIDDLDVKQKFFTYYMSTFPKEKIEICCADRVYSGYCDTPYYYTIIEHTVYVDVEPVKFSALKPGTWFFFVYEKQSVKDRTYFKVLKDENGNLGYANLEESVFIIPNPDTLVCTEDWFSYPR